MSGYERVMIAIRDVDLAEVEVRYNCGQKLKFDLTKKYDILSQDLLEQWLSNIEWGRVVKVKWKTCSSEKTTMYMPGCGGKSRHKSKHHHHDGCKCEKCKKHHHHDGCKCGKCKKHHHHHECDPCRPDPCCSCNCDPCCCKPRFVWRDHDPYTRFQPKPQIPYKHYPAGNC